MSDNAAAALAAFCAFIGFILGVFAGSGIGAESIREEAVKAGAAEYYLDGSHHRQFRWKNQ